MATKSVTLNMSIAEVDMTPMNFNSDEGMPLVPANSQASLSLSQQSTGITSAEKIAAAKSMNASSQLNLSNELNRSTGSNLNRSTGSNLNGSGKTLHSCNPFKRRANLSASGAATSNEVSGTGYTPGTASVLESTMGVSSANPSTVGNSHGSALHTTSSPSKGGVGLGDSQSSTAAIDGSTVDPSTVGLPVVDPSLAPDLASDNSASGSPKTKFRIRRKNANNMSTSTGNETSNDASQTMLKQSTASEHARKTADLATATLLEAAQELSQPAEKEVPLTNDRKPLNASAATFNVSAGGAANPTAAGSNNKMGNSQLNASSSNNSNSIRWRNVYVARLPPMFTANDLHQLCASFGPIQSARLMMDPKTNKSRGFGFVLFTTEAAAQEAVEGLDRIQIRTNDGATATLEVRFASATASQSAAKQANASSKSVQVAQIPGPQVTAIGKPTAAVANNHVDPVLAGINPVMMAMGSMNMSQQQPQQPGSNTTSPGVSGADSATMTADPTLAAAMFVQQQQQAAAVAAAAAQQQTQQSTALLQQQQLMILQQQQQLMALQEQQRQLLLAQSQNNASSQKSPMGGSALDQLSRSLLPAGISSTNMTGLPLAGSSQEDESSANIDAAFARAMGLSGSPQHIQQSVSQPGAIGTRH